MLLSVAEIKEAMNLAFDSIRANKFRAGLTMLGVMVGVGSVISLASIINSMNLAAQEEINNFGSNLIFITKFGHDVDWDNLSDEERNRKPITVNEAKVILANASLINGVCPQNYYFNANSEVKYKGNKAGQPQIFGTWPDYVPVCNRSLISGRFITETDLLFRNYVCVLGFDIAKTLFEDEDPIDKEIRVNGSKFTVIGVMEEYKSNFGDDGDSRAVIMPLTTFELNYPWEEELWLIARAQSYQQIEAAKDEITSILRVSRRVPFNSENSFALATQDNIREEVNDITGVMYIVMLVITSVGLMVGGIGVMNIMLVSVTERTREIGVRKAIGAKRSNIIVQFLTEATTMSGTGGIIGIIIGVIIGLSVNAIAGWPLSISVPWVFIGFSVAVSVGIISGIYPAIKASRLDPIEALRYE